ncbi:uncharacterized protein NECHADRAFT_86861 [Fusarium vanettenii 77-13-4]|uniref:Heterokaryon incompatibility domain-containing protein n=1 Tax=Fusarium vanettenii (strain ATCC MYA-4622 / CBS 123669 / FGSC 9596 / NRRL 45880 / 77-13-4) TaxID=660122 RepID=C7ZK10_FUSV7|nr:uncharacterized protein NECHADRAFT_86861 [Fusarium vanettenii 77-13-4]EEU35644.1 hypothetical protein NECHADRAFT_86861 [Fusarium vanettenii 77-13-4]
MAPKRGSSRDPESPPSVEQSGLIPLLLEIQECRIPQQKMIWIVENLECLGRRQSKKRKLGSLKQKRSADADEEPFWFRQEINAFNDSNFVALSYTWEASETEVQNPKEEGHLIETRDRKNAYHSSVRNSVLERITRYMQRHQVPLLWIDRHSIPQKVCQQPTCKHEACNKKQHALDAMDRVYSLSNHPVALLGRPIEKESEMATLAAVLKGQLVECVDGDFRLRETTTYEKAQEALQLLYEITTDKWWSRAWTFQENYRAGLKMTLLIHHSPGLEKPKRIFRLSGKALFNLIPGELSVQSVRFSENATKFCLAFRKLAKTRKEDEEKVQHILRTAGKYTLLLEKSTSMSGIIVSDVLARGVTEPWDLLAIIANCCQYATRLKSTMLQEKSKTGVTLTLSILALRLLNGEILRNELAIPASVIDRIHDLFFDGFRAPQGERNLTFNKGCRFVDVKLAADGIKTTGHLWKLDERLKAPRSSPRLSQESQKGQHQLPDCHRTRLLQLMELLRANKRKRCTTLINDLKAFLDEDAMIEDEGSFGLRYRRMMAKELVRAMDADEGLSLGCLCDSSGSTTVHRGIFITGPKASSLDDQSVAHVFTSLWSETNESDEYYGNDLDHHVSLGVEMGDLELNGPCRLYTKKWVLGLCFFEGVTAYDVVFPWPSGLREQRVKSDLEGAKESVL